MDLPEREAVHIQRRTTAAEVKEINVPGKLLLVRASQQIRVSQLNDLYFLRGNVNNSTALDISEARDALENEAASLLGHMLFEFGRLEMNLGLCLAWSDGGANLEARTKVVECQNFNSKIAALSDLVDAKLPLGSKRRLAYENWILRAHAVRAQRNTLAHGRWGVDPIEDRVINVGGLPTADIQKTAGYSINELSSINQEIRDLQMELGRIRGHWPL